MKSHIERLASGRFLLLALFLATLPLVTPKIRGADEIEYFSHLRSLVFDRDLEFGNEYQHFHDRDAEGLAGFKATFLELREPATGRHVNFAPVGSAILWSPFYLCAHVAVLAARGLGASVAADGYSLPYVAAACYASAFYGLLGLLLAHDGLVRFSGVSQPAATSAVASVWLGTPLLYYMTIAPAFSHASSVFTVALVLWLSLRLHSARTLVPAEWALVGLAVGLAALVREQDALFASVPLALLTHETVRSRRLAEGFRSALVLAICAALVFTPQLLAYRWLGGHFGPSELVARKMTYTSPHFFAVLFDAGHGLFAWSPLLVPATLGLLIALCWRLEAVRTSLAAALLLQVWINGSLESWTAAGAFGSRRFVSATPVFAWGLGLAVAWALPRLGKAAVAVTLGLAVWWNVSLMVQFGLKLMNRQQLDWPRVAVNQLTEVPIRLPRATLLFFTDRERLAKEGL